MLEEMLKNVREKSPLIHNITNYVTVNDCANVVLACGASPIMADDQEEVAEITSICTGLNINIGTLNSRTIESMLIAGKKANELHHPVVLDPVGVGASTLRTQTALKLLDEIQFSVIRGNISEIKTLALGSGTTKGVDANIADKVTKENIKEVVRFAQEFSRKTGAIIAITGAIDLVCSYSIFYFSKPCSFIRSNTCCGMYHGISRRNGTHSTYSFRWKCKLSKLYYRCHLQYDSSTTTRRCKVPRSFILRKEKNYENNR